jgi:hypothetical protein
MTKIEVLEMEALRRVVVGVENDGAELQFARAVGDFVSRHFGRKQSAGK